MDLSGTWQFATDEHNAGIAQQWFLNVLEESIQLPSTMDAAGKGHSVVQVNPAHLNRKYQYEGPAWYRREVTIPSSWQESRLSWCWSGQKLLRYGLTIIMQEAVPC
jgi:beta-galactosidase/beta-glucuronidase